ncbi:diguanylate cyclase [Crateriforma conspicua]|uniref:diguanylate cyclase n=1 Tax=Crateriforma conspicua TaxID=2527996 RepID=A0A5C6FNV9_9PLAN|nr:diguanylate cyclase [Crateriforma conspicua]TWU64837.1 putative diguanylate cyclase YdaM [Crateriforma conspicua]
MSDLNPSCPLESSANPAFAPVVAASPAASDPTNPPVAPPESRVGDLLAGLRENALAPADSGTASQEAKFENHLAMVRLGMATSLYYALRTKHAPTAAHCLRVALACSAWAQRLGLNDESRDRIEVAALLHDLGKIGIPDRILRKPGKLSVDEQLAMGTCPQIACEILRGCTADTELLDIIRYADTWYDSRRQDESMRGDALPLGSRMLSIASAFDAMTTDQVYRPALSRERAISELIRGSGTQFDPELSLDFGVMLEQRPELLQGAVVNRWLQKLGQDVDRPMIGGDAAALQVNTQTTRKYVKRRDEFFLERLSDHMTEGMVFADGEGTVERWNHAMTRMTGIAADAIIGQRWKDETLRLRDTDGTRSGCPVTDCLRGGGQVSKKMMIERPGKDPLPVHIQVSPVMGSEPGLQGVVVILHDLSDKADLEQRLEKLNNKVTRDPLTGVANRAEFDRQLLELTESAKSGEATFSLVICDIDHFKQVNDVHGHPAGDDALVQFARLLESHSRDDDLVARYGGEEFLLLSANCDNATATRRAEAVRQALELMPLKSIGNDCITASFGVTEFQSGDTSQTILARADRALLQAKSNGRNRVIQLGSGRATDASESVGKRSGWLGWLDGNRKAAKEEFVVLTTVPLELAVEKLRGFIADHHAEIIQVKADQLELRVNALCSSGGRRVADQQITLQVLLTLSDQMSGARVRQTRVHAHIRPVRNRDRRRRELHACVSQVVSSLNCYLMGQVQSAEEA